MFYMKRYILIPIIACGLMAVSSCGRIKRVSRIINSPDVNFYRNLGGQAYKDVDLNTNAGMQEYTYENIINYGVETIDNENTDKDIGASSHSGDGTKIYSFFKKTFYVENCTPEIRKYEFSFNIKKISGSDEGYQTFLKTLRLMLFENYVSDPDSHDYFVYAKESSTIHVDNYGDETTMEYISTPEYGFASPFIDDNTLTIRNIILEPNELLRYTFVIWIEGYDQDSNNVLAPKDAMMSFEFNHKSKAL